MDSAGCSGGGLSALQKQRPLHLTACGLPSLSLPGSHIERVAGRMVRDLKPQKVVDCCQRQGVIGCDADAPSVVEGLVVEVDLVFQQLHRGNAGRSCRVHEHGNGEITFAEGFRDVSEMHTDGLNVGSILKIIRGDLNETAMLCEAKVVHGLVMGKAHRVVAMVFDASVMSVGSHVRRVHGATLFRRRGRLWSQASGHASQKCKNERAETLFHFCFFLLNGSWSVVAGTGAPFSEWRRSAFPPDGL